jgi:hypothetical protein
MFQVRAFSASEPSSAAEQANEWLRDRGTESKAIESITVTESASLDSLGRRRPSYTVWVVYRE